MPIKQRGLQTLRSDQTPVLGSALRPYPQSATSDHTRLALLGLPSGQTLVQNLTKELTTQQLASVHASPAMIGALVQLQLLGRLQVIVLPQPLLHRRIPGHKR